MRISQIVCFVVTLSACAFASRPAAAFERQWHFGGGVGAALPRHYSLGPALGMHAAYGISDMFDAKLELLGSLHSIETPQSPDETSAQLFSAAAGITYKWDVLQWVPYGGLLVGYYYLGGALAPGMVRSDVGLSLVLGLDYAVSRSFGLGVQVRPHLFFLQNGSDLQYSSALLRAEYRFGW